MSKWLKLSSIIIGINVLCSHANAFEEEQVCDPNKYDTASMTICAMQTYDHEEEVMNRIYNELLMSSDTKQRYRLKRSQQAWQQFVKRDCDFQTGLEMGTIRPLMRIGCEQEYVEQRSQDLAKHLSVDSELHK